MKIYVDLTTEKDCVGLLLHEPVELVLSGTVPHWEAERYRDTDLAEAFRKKGIHFWFGAAPESAVYTIPQSTLLAHDGGTGYFLTTEEGCYYYNKEGLFYIGAELRDIGEDWRQTMVPSTDIAVYPSRQAAEQHHHIHTLQELMEELQ